MWLLPVSLLFLLTLISCQEYRVLDFGAVGDGITFDTQAVRAAMAAAANSNGGRVIFDQGYTFLTGPFNITSNVIVDIRGTILGSPNKTDYYPIPQDPWFLDWSPSQSHSLILAYEAENITITGGGLINGQAENWNCSGCVGPFTLKLIYTNDSVIENINLLNCPRWTLVLGYATNIHVNHVNITNPLGTLPINGDGISNDGYDIVCSVNITLENSYYKGGDDGVMIKSGRHGPALQYGRASENIYVRNMTLETSGGIGAGVEITAGVRNVTYEDINLIGAVRGINVQSQRGMGGFIEDMTFRNIKMVNVNRTIIFSKWYTWNNGTSNTPIFKNIVLDNITIDNSQMSPNWFSYEWELNGAEESPIEGFTNVYPSCPPCLNQSQETTTTLAPTTTTTTIPKKPLTTCAGAIDLVFVIDGSDTMTASRFNTLKTQLALAVTQSNITWGDNKAHVGIVLSTGLMPNGRTTPYRYLDLNGCQFYAWDCTPTITTTAKLITAIKNMPFYGGKNNIALSMNETMTGEYDGLPDSWVIFGDPYWNTVGDRPDVSDVMIVISGKDTSNVSPVTNALLNKGVKIYSIGFSDLPTTQLQAISGSATTPFTTTPQNLASVIKNICQFK